MARYSRAEDVVVGTPLANRSRPELEGLIGYFVNTVALRTDLSGRPRPRMEPRHCFFPSFRFPCCSSTRQQHLDIPFLPFWHLYTLSKLYLVEA